MKKKKKKKVDGVSWGTAACIDTCITYNNVVMVFFSFPWVWGKELLFLEMVVLFREVASRWEF